MNISVIQSTIDAIDKPVIFINPDYTIHAVNQAYRETYKSDIQLGSSRCHQVSHKSDVPCDQNGESCPLQACLSTGRANSVVHVHHTKRGKQFCDILMKPVKDDDGITIGFLEVLEDIQYASADKKDDKMIGESDHFLQMLQQVNRAAKSDIAVLLQGETGTGKELVAKALHDQSARSKSPFIVIECTGLTENLFESELFGHEKGAFTGATHSKKGLIESANGGTVFFDEIGDVPLNMQVKLLRLLETHTFRSVGGLKQKKSDFRFLCATHKNLKQMVADGDFRADLYYRIAGFPIALPSLRQRKADIPLLAEHFLAHSEHNHKRFEQVVLDAIATYPFPGNIRELKNLVEQLALLSDEDSINLTCLPDYIFESDDVFKKEREIMTLEQAEKMYLKKVVINAGLSIEELADALDVSSRTLYRKLQKYGLSIK